MSSCVNCGTAFEARARGYKRFPIYKTLSESVEVKDLLEEVLELETEAITPLEKSGVSVGERCLCDVCYSYIQKIAKRTREITELKQQFYAKREPLTYLGKKERTAKRSRSALTPSKTPRKEKKSKASVDEACIVESEVPKKLSKKSFRRRAADCILNSKYKAAFRLLTRISKTAKQAFIEVAQSLARKDISAYCKASSYTSQLLTMESLQDFSWAKYFGETQQNLPTLYAVLEATVTTRRSVDQIRIDEHGKLGPLVPGFGFVLSMLLNLKKSRRFRLVQSIVSSQLYRHGCSQKLITWLHKAGLCLSIWGGRTVIDRLTQHYDKEAKFLKDSLEACVSGEASQTKSPQGYSSDEGEELMPVSVAETWVETDSTESEMETEGSQSLSGESESQEASTSATDRSDEEWEELKPEETAKESRRKLFERDSVDVPTNGYSLTWDNVQHLAIRRHQGSSEKNTFHLWAMAFLTENRINFDYLIGNKEMCLAADLPLQTYLPQKHDWIQLKKRMVVMVQRILIDNFPEMHGLFEKCVQQHIPHAYSEESAQKSHVVNLGVQQEDPASTKGVIRIMKHLQQYVPENMGTLTNSILVNGDQLPVERMISARMSMASSEEKRNRFIGMEPSPQEFHKRCLLLQDTMNQFFNSKSVGEKGTLYNIKTKFGHRGVKKHVMDCVNHCTDFMNFTTQGMVCLLALEVGKMSDLAGLPEGCPALDSSLAERKQFLNKFAETIVECCWPCVYETTIEAVSRVLTDNVGLEDSSECICEGKVVSDTFTIECSARSRCHRKRFYHPSCVGHADSLPEDDWWCCDNCREFSIYCICRENREDQWIGCESNDFCLKSRQGWFHLSCVGLDKLPSGEWFCCEDCKEFYEEHSATGKSNTTVDHIQEYSHALLWEGLWHLVHKDAERENDGRAMISHWRLDMLKFWSGNHYKYLSLGHRLLAGVSGWLPPRLAEELTWSRVHNLRGGAGNNIPLDLINEFLNNDFKQNLKKVRGRYTDKQVERTSHMIGSVGLALDDLCDHQLMEKFVHKSKKRTISYKTDISKFVRTYRDCNLFEHVDGRMHPTFPEFRNTIIVKSPAKLKGRLCKYSKKLDVEKAVLDMP